MIYVCGGIGGIIVGAATGAHFADVVKNGDEKWTGAVAGISVAGGAYLVGVTLLAIGAAIREFASGGGLPLGEVISSLVGGFALGIFGGIPYFLIAVAIGGAVGHGSQRWLGIRAQTN